MISTTLSPFISNSIFDNKCANNHFWEQRKLGEMGSTFTGLSGKTKDDFGHGEAQFVTYMNVYTNPVADLNMTEKVEVDPRQQSVKYGDIFFTTSSETPDEVGMSSVWLGDAGNTYLNSFCFGYRPEKKIDPYYMAFMLRSAAVRKKLIYLAQGISRYNISKNRAMNIEILLPGLDEQKKIGEYFKSLDHLITLHQRKYEKLLVIKKSMLGKMFPKAGEKVPEIRFAGFTDDWEQRKLGELCERVTRKNITGESDLPLTIASQYGLIDQRDFFNKVVAAKDMSNYYLLKKGEFAYNKSYSNGYDFGSIKRLNAYEQGCLSTLYICFGITSDDIESDYLECFFDTLKWYSDITMICAEGARNHGLLNVDTKAFFDEVTIEMPSSKEEQRKISSYLNNLDNLITLHQREQNYLHLEKKYDWI